MSQSPYPTVGMIAVTALGNRIAVWPAESDDPDCFTGQLLEAGASAARNAVHNVSIHWVRSAIVRLEPPTAADRAISLVRLEEVANG